MNMNLNRLEEVNKSAARLASVDRALKALDHHQEYSAHVDVHTQWNDGFRDKFEMTAVVIEKNDLHTFLKAERERLKALLKDLGVEV